MSGEDENSPGHPGPPASCAWAFKEWSGICDALAAGRQAIVLRKGGIAEGPGGFDPEHDAFWLYPTAVHQAEQGLRPVGLAGLPASPPPPPGFVDMRALAVVAAVRYVDRPEVLDKLADLHIWTAGTIARRFAYRRPGLWALAVRVYVRPGPLRIAESPAFAGCKSWVPLEAPLPCEGLSPAQDDAAFAAALGRLVAETEGTAP